MGQDMVIVSSGSCRRDIRRDGTQVRGHEAEGVQVSLETSGSSPDAESPDTAGPAPQSKKEGREDQEQTKRESRSIQVVDVKDVVEIEVPAQWAEDPDTHAIKAELTKKAAEIAEKWDRQPVDSQMESFDKTTGSYGYSEESNRTSWSGT